MRPLGPFILTAAVALVSGGCGEDSGDGDGAGAPATSAARAQEPGGGCERAETPSPNRDGGVRRPKRTLDSAKTYHVTFTTSCGKFTVRLDQKTSPETAASFASLVKKGFYDGTVFHRIVPGFVIQGGDPTGTGKGGPGYSTRDTPPVDATYTRGVVAMAKSESEPAGTAGSQFYVVTGADAALPPQYALLGKVTEGLRVTARIDALGDPKSGGAGTPLQPVVIEKASLKAG